MNMTRINDVGKHILEQTEASPTALPHEASGTETSGDDAAEKDLHEFVAVLAYN